MFAKLNRNWLIGAVVIVVISLLVFLNHTGNIFGHEEEMTQIDEPISYVEDEQIEPLYVIVDVKGEVHNPGVYDVGSDVRIHHVIDLAGGFTSEANEDVINLAQKVHDEMVIFVPAIGDENEQTLHLPVSSDKIRINYATQEEIEQLNGIGPAKASAIIEYREENGYFESVEDLLNISGIGEKTLENFREDIQIP